MLTCQDVQEVVPTVGNPVAVAQFGTHIEYGTKAQAKPFTIVAVRQLLDPAFESPCRVGRSLSHIRWIGGDESIQSSKPSRTLCQVWAWMPDNPLPKPAGLPSACAGISDRFEPEYVCDESKSFGNGLNHSNAPRLGCFQLAEA